MVNDAPNDTDEKMKNKKKARFTTIMTICLAITALVSATTGYIAILEGSVQSEKYVDGQKVLSEANTANLEANQEVGHELNYFIKGYEYELKAKRLLEEAARAGLDNQTKTLLNAEAQIAAELAVEFFNLSIINIFYQIGNISTEEAIMLYLDDLYAPSTQNRTEAYDLIEKGHLHNKRHDQYQSYILVFSLAVFIIALSIALQTDRLMLKYVLGLLGFGICIYGFIGVLLI